MEGSIEWLVQKIKEEVFSSSTDHYSFVPSSAYDTAWVAMIPHPHHPNRPMFPKCLDWILHHQRDGGFWGEPDHLGLPTIECLTATLVCMAALKTWNAGALHLEEGLSFLRANMEKLLKKNSGGESSAQWFTIVFPGMIELAQAKGLQVLPEGYTQVVKDAFSERQKIFELEETFNRDGRLLPLAALMYLEVLPAAVRGMNHEAILEHQREDGSLFRSPSATSWAFMITGDEGCKVYLEAMVQRCGHGVPPMYPIDEDLIKLCLIDHLERLGCARYFSKEIEDVMSQAYSNWVMEEPQNLRKHDVKLELYKDSLAFRLLRKHGHRVSPRRFCWFMQDEEMLSHMEQNYTQFLGVMYNVYRATNFTFRREDGSEKAKIFSRKLLQKKGLPTRNLKDGIAVPTNFQKEIEHELKLPWLARMEHLEHRIYIERSGVYELWIGKSTPYRLSCSSNTLQLAKKNFTTLQSIYKAELEELKRWSKESGLSNIGFGREKTAYIYFSVVVNSCLSLTSDVRKVITKCAVIVTVADDFFDEEGSLDELYTLTGAVQRWDAKGLSSHSKVIFDALDDLVNDIASKSSNQRGHNVKEILQNMWREAFESWLTEAEWSRKGHAPSIDEYLKVGMISIAMNVMLLPACYLISPELPEYSKSTRYSMSTKLLMVSARLLNDIQSYQKEREDGKLNMVLLYLKENPKADIEDSIAFIMRVLDRTKKELIELVLTNQYNDMPREWKELHLLCLKTFQMFFNSSNVYDSPTALLQSINKAIYEPLLEEVHLSPLPMSLPHSYESKKENVGVNARFGDSKNERVLLMKADQGRVGGAINKATHDARAMPLEIRRPMNHLGSNNFDYLPFPPHDKVCSTPWTASRPLFWM